MFSIRQTATAFAKIDGLADAGLPALDKALRNLTQRHYLPPAERDGRADLYAVETVCALRFAERLTRFGVDRAVLDDFLRFLQIAPTAGRTQRGDGNNVRVSLIEEAVERAREGENFEVGLTMAADGRVRPMAWFATGGNPLVEAYRQTHPADAVLRLDGGRLIRDVLAALSDGTN